MAENIAGFPPRDGGNEGRADWVSKEELEASLALITPALGALSDVHLARLITMSQYCTDVLLNEIESRGNLTFRDGMVIVPYHSDHVVETILTRGGPAQGLQ
jgi:hypothetical protein